MKTDTIEADTLELTPIDQSAKTGALATQQRSALAIADTSPVAVMLAALERGAAPETIEKMMDLQERFEANAARKAFNKALAAFKAEPLVVRKNKQVGYTTREGDFVGYKHAELSEVVEAVSAALGRHGLSFRWDVKQTAQWITVMCILRHEDGHAESVEMGGPPDASGKKNAIQQIASTTSYLQRYTLKAITGVAEAGDDDDGQGGADDGTSSPPAPPAPRAHAAAPEPYWTDAKFAASLPAWHKAIAAGKAGKGGAESVIAKAETKGPLTEQQKAEIRKVQQAPAVTYAEVAERLAAAKTRDALDEAATLISAVKPDQQAELSALYETRQKELA